MGNKSYQVRALSGERDRALMHTEAGRHQRYLARQWDAGALRDHQQQHTKEHVN